MFVLQLLLQAKGNLDSFRVSFAKNKIEKESGAPRLF